MTHRAEKLIVSVGLAAILHPTFQAVAAVANTRSIPPPRWLLTPFDTLPVVPMAVWIYLSWYPATAAVLLTGCETFRRAYAAYLVAFAVSITSYLLFPVTITRSPVATTTGASSAMLRAVYTLDLPVNLFPSFHAAVAAILWRLRPTSGVISLGVSVWALALCAACILTKQHYVLDVGAGVIVGILALQAVDFARTAWRLGDIPKLADAGFESGSVEQ